MKNTVKPVAIAASLITLGSLSGTANAAITVVGNPAVSATVQVTSPITWTITSSGQVAVLCLDEAMSSPDGGQSEPTMVGGTFLLTNLSTGQSVTLTDFGDGNLTYGDMTPGDSYFWVGSGNPTLPVTAGDTVQLSSSSPISFSDPGFDPDWSGFSFVGHTYLVDNSGLSKTALAIPEPSSALLLGGGMLGLMIRRKRNG